MKKEKKTSIGGAGKNYLHVSKREMISTTKKEKGVYNRKRLHIEKEKGGERFCCGEQRKRGKKV